MPSLGAVTEVARFYARRNFTVSGRTVIEGLLVEATDGPFATGAGPLVSGTTLAFDDGDGRPPRLLRRPEGPGRLHHPRALFPIASNFAFLTGDCAKRWVSLAIDLPLSAQ